MIPIIHQYYLKLHQQPFPYTLFITTPGFLLSALLSYRIFKKRHKEDILTLGIVDFPFLSFVYFQFVCLFVFISNLTIETKLMN
jgi:hypothetical protein